MSCGIRKVHVLFLQNLLKQLLNTLEMYLHYLRNFRNFAGDLRGRKRTRFHTELMKTIPNQK